MQNNYAISAGHPSTLEAAKEVLTNGGNAVDAAIAAYFTSFIAEPCMASAGAGGFAMVSDGRKTNVIDFFCQTPKTKIPSGDLDFYPVTIDFGTATEDFYVGHGAAATPGAIAGIFSMHTHYGSIPIREIAKAVITKAKEGIKMDSFQAYDLQLLKDIFAISSEGKSLFFNDQELLKEGEVLKMDQFADFLEALSIEGPDLFYKGEIAQKVTKDFVQKGGNLRYEDFSSYEAKIRSPLQFTWAGHEIFTTPSPSAGGAIIAAFLLEYIKGNEGVLPTPLSNEHYRSLVSTFETVNAVKDSPQALAEFLKSQFNISVPSSNPGHKWSGTSHFNVIDNNGLAIALTTSIGEGCGYFIPGTDMQMNNMLGEAALLPNGYHSWTPNQRLRSMMTPTMVKDQEGKLRMVTGTGGAGRIPFAIAQTIINHILYGMQIEEATRNPRIHVHNGVTNLEKGYHVNSEENLTMWEPGSLYFGGVGSISIQKDSYLKASGDYRRSGVSEAKN